MAQFQYSGRDNTGALVSGSLDAGNADDAAAQLFGSSVTPIEIREVKGQGRKKAPLGKTRKAKLGSDASTVERINAFLASDKIDADDLIMFARQMHSLTKAGLPLDRALKGMEASLSNLAFREVLKGVIEGLGNGMDLASALGMHPKVFSKLFLSLVHIGENTGRLDMAFSEIGKYLELEKTTRKQVKSAIRYPLFVMSAIAVALAVITVFVIPVFSDTFERLGAELPWQTQLLMNTSNFVINYWPFILISIFGSIYGFIYWSNTDKGRLTWDEKKLGIPLVGAVLEKVALARFSRSFSIVMAAGVPIIQGLTIVGGAVGNAYTSLNIYAMREGVERGESLHRTASSTGMFSPLVLQMIAIGEETGTVDELLAEVADFYDSEVEYDLGQMSDAIEPILISFIGGLVLILALGVFLPIWDLNTAANG